MGRPEPMNGTVGATIKKLQQIQAALQAGDTATVQAFLNEAISACSAPEYVVLKAEGETLE